MHKVNVIIFENAEGKLISSTRRRLCIDNFVISIDSIIWVARQLLFVIDNPFKYFLTYKTSQNHLELFFLIPYDSLCVKIQILLLNSFAQLIEL